MTVSFIVHDDPVGRSAKNYIARADLAPYGLSGEMEQLWLRPASAGTYEVACVPFRVYGLAYLDVVTLSEDGAYVERVVTPSGRRVFRVLVMPSLGADGMSKMHDALNQTVRDLGLLSEWSGDRHIAIDVPPGTNVRALAELVMPAAAERHLYYEWADAQPFRPRP